MLLLFILYTNIILSYALVYRDRWTDARLAGQQRSYPSLKIVFLECEGQHIATIIKRAAVISDARIGTVLYALFLYSDETDGSEKLPIFDYDGLWWS